MFPLSKAATQVSGRVLNVAASWRFMYLVTGRVGDCCVCWFQTHGLLVSPHTTVLYHIFLFYFSFLHLVHPPFLPWRKAKTTLVAWSSPVRTARMCIWMSSDLTFVGHQLGIFTERLGVINLITIRWALFAISCEGCSTTRSTELSDRKRELHVVVDPSIPAVYQYWALFCSFTFFLV